MFELTQRDGNGDSLVARSSEWEGEHGTLEAATSSPSGPLLPSRADATCAVVLGEQSGVELRLERQTATDFAAAVHLAVDVHVSIPAQDGLEDVVSRTDALIGAE